MSFEKMLYFMVHLAGPLIYLISNLVWGIFGLSKNWWEVLSDHLSILGIYYLGVSILWITNLDAIKKTGKDIKKTDG
ncbi:hypothetical protein [Metabacillus sp. 84]|uniref:hypothetical protein n=1 Tax=unclassified Metabacillus TaxID=2675274 RepID=UPI003CFB6AC6